MNEKQKDKNGKLLSLGDKVRHPYKFGSGGGIVYYSHFESRWGLRAPDEESLCFEIPFNECELNKK